MADLIKKARRTRLPKVDSNEILRQFRNSIYSGEATIGERIPNMQRLSLVIVGFLQQNQKL